MKRIGIDSMFALDRIPPINPYGVKWVTNNSSPTLTKGYLQNGAWVPGTPPILDVQIQMKRCVLNASGVHQYYLDPGNSIYREGQTTPTATGTNTSTSTSHLVDSGADFSTAGVTAGMWVHNVTDGWCSLIKSVTATDLTLADDIFLATGKTYNIGTANPMADGAVYVEVPQFSYVWTEDGTDTYFIINQYPFQFNKSDGSVVKSRVHEWYYEGDLAIPSTKKYIGAFESVWYSSAAGDYSDHNGSTVGVSGDKAVSLPGYKPLGYQFRRKAIAPYQGFAGLHAAFGTNHHNHGYYAWEAIWILLTIEYASLNGQQYLPGYTQANANAYATIRRTGRTMLLGNLSGNIAPALASGQIDYDVATSYGIVAGEKVAMSYRGIENVYGSMRPWIDGINIKFEGSPLTNAQVYLCNHPDNWAEGTATNYTDAGVSVPLASGYIVKLHPGRMLPKTASGGGSVSYLCDYYYASTTAQWAGVFVGGDVYSPDTGGPAYFRADRVGDTYRYGTIGGRAAV